MEFWKSLSGMLTVEMTSAVPEDTLAAITKAQIPVSHVVQISELKYCLEIPRRDYKQLSSMMNRQGNRLKICRKWGLYWPIQRLFHRPVLVSLLLILLGTSFYLPTRIFFVEVEGNDRIPDRLILSAAEDCGIRFGASRKLVRSEKVKNALLSSVHQLQWAGINTSGCRAVISVRERVEDKTVSETNLVSNLIADRDGYILSATVTSGTPQFQIGETVTKGQLLVSGYTDCGICIRASRSEGEILAQTRRKLVAVMPEIYLRPVTDPEANYKISLLIGKKRINLWKDSRISTACCGRMYEEYYISLPGGFQLPLAVCVDTYRAYELQDAAVSEEDAFIQLQQFSDHYLCKQMVAGQIIQSRQVLSTSDQLHWLESSYICTEMIGKECREEIGDINGKRN